MRYINSQIQLPNPRNTLFSLLTVSPNECVGGSEVGCTAKIVM